MCGGGSPTELITALRYVQAPSSPTSGTRTKFRLLSDGEANICRLYDSRTVIRKIMNSRCLRRWETHHLVLGPVEIYSTTVSLVHISADILLARCCKDDCDSQRKGTGRHHKMAKLIVVDVNWRYGHSLSYQSPLSRARLVGPGRKCTPARN